MDTVSVMRDMTTGRGRGFAFVEMNTDAEAQAAIQKFNEYSLGGRNLTVNEAPAEAGALVWWRWRRRPRPSFRAALVSGPRHRVHDPGCRRDGDGDAPRPYVSGRRPFLLYTCSTAARRTLDSPVVLGGTSSF